MKTTKPSRPQIRHQSNDQPTEPTNVLIARIAELEAANVALGHEKELALAEAYRECERLRAELAEAKRLQDATDSMLNKALACAKGLQDDLRTARKGIEEAVDYLRNGTLFVVKNTIERLTGLLAEIGEK